MKRYYLNEDNKLAKLPVRYSNNLTEKIEYIKLYNMLEKEGMERWLNDLKGFVSWLSNPVIAWDNHNDFTHYDNGEISIDKYGILFKVLTDKDEQGNERNFVYVVDMILTPQDYNLNAPSNINENKKNKQYNTMNNIRKKVKLSESQLCDVIKESVKQVLSELDWKTYANATKKAIAKRDKRVNLFQDAEDKEFNKKYGFDDHDERNDADYYWTSDHSYRMKNGEPTYRQKRYAAGKGSTDDTVKFNGFGYKHNYYDPKYPMGVETQPYYFHYYDKAKKGDEDFSNYAKGNYDYDNEHGWHLKDEKKLEESIKRSIRKYLHS